MQSASIWPLWHRGRTPYWLLPSLVGNDDACKQRLRSVFRAAVANDQVFSHAVDVDDTRHALDEVAEYDAFRDGFLVLPALQSMYVPLFFSSFPPCVVDLGDNHRLATLPGEEGVDGLLKLSNPQILAGCVACISLLTMGSGPLACSLSRHRHRVALWVTCPSRLVGIASYTDTLCPQCLVILSLRPRSHDIGPPQRWPRRRVTLP